MSNIDPNEGLLNALGYKDIEEINYGAGRVVNFDNADPKEKELTQKIRALEIEINRIKNSGDTSFSSVRYLIQLKQEYQNELQAVTKASALQAVTSTGANAAGTPAEEQKQVTPDDLRKKRLARYGKKRQGGILRYPLESMTQHTDYLQIDIEKYEAIGSNYITSTGSDDRYVIGNARQNRAGRTSSSKLAKKPLINAGTIILPIPSNLQDTNNVNYGESSLNGLAAVGVSAVEEGMIGLGNFIGSGGADKIDFASFTGNIKNRLEAGLGAGDRETALTTASDIVAKKLISDAVSIFGGNVTTNQLLSRESGEILNPNMELLFNDVTVRNFRFSFKFTPRNPKEAQQVKLIIRAFKRNMAPQAQGGISGSGNFFLRAPNVFKLRYRSGNKDHPFLNKFKQCFLTDVQTTYTGEGVHTTYDDGTPVSIILDLSFKEIQPIYDIDYDEFPGTGAVGY